MVGYGHQFWVWACGTQTTKCKKSTNVITFDANDPDESGYDTFPLDAGKYIVYLVRDNASGPPYESYLQSSTFTVMEAGKECPSPQPTASPNTPPTPTVSQGPSPVPSEGPTPNPNPYPTISSQPSPAPSCTVSVTTDYSCYYPGESVEVTFSNCELDEQDWVGIYPATSDPDDLGYSLVWFYLCGSQSCDTKVSHDTIVFGYGGRNERGTIAWPLPSGTSYRAFLIKEVKPGGGYMASAFSEEFFFLDKDSDSCDADNNGSRSRKESSKSKSNK